MIHTDPTNQGFKRSRISIEFSRKALGKKEGRKERKDGDERGSKRSGFCWPSNFEGTVLSLFNTRFLELGPRDVPLGIPEGEARAALAQAFRWNVLSIGPCSRLSRYTSLVCEQILDSERALLDTGKGIARTAG